MSSAGCSAASKATIGTLAVFGDSGQLEKYNCGSAGINAGKAALRAWYAAVRAAGRKTFMMATEGYWELVYDYSDPMECAGWMYTGTTHEGIVYDYVNHVYTDHYTAWFSAVGCSVRDHYTARWVGGTGDTGGGGDGGQPNPPPVVPLDSVPVPPDSACRSNADAVPLTIPAAPPNPGTLPPYGPLGSLTIQNALVDLANAAWASPTHSERGGMIVVQNGVYSFIELANIYTDICRYQPAPYSLNPPSGAVIAALVHSHPPEGTDITISNCLDPNTSPGPAATGPSPGDLTNADTFAAWTNTNYVVQSTSTGMTFRRFGTEASGVRYINPNVWVKTKPIRCAQI